MHNHICTHVNINWIPEGSIPAHGEKHLHRTTGCLISAGNIQSGNELYPERCLLIRHWKSIHALNRQKKKREKSLGDVSDVIV